MALAEEVVVPEVDDVVVEPDVSVVVLVDTGPEPVAVPAVLVPEIVVEPEVVVPPREAFFAVAEPVGVRAAVGRISAELIAPYPPGIPVLAPGEEVTPSVIEALDSARSAGIRIAYAADPTLSTIRVVQI